MPQPGYVYIVHGVGTNFVKVGKSKNIMKRLQEIAQGVPFPLQILSIALVADMDTAERTLLTLYREYKAQGEWFALPPDLLAQWPVEAQVKPAIALREGYEATPRKGMRGPMPYAASVAIPWLRELLQDGPVRATTIETVARERGVTKYSMWQARKLLGIQAKRDEECWYWELPRASSAPEEEVS